VLGYHLSGTRFNDDNFEAIEANKQYSSRIPDVVLVKKSYARKKKAKNRAWRLKRMAREYEEEAVAAAAAGAGQQTRREQQEANRLEQDYEMFLRDVEEDQELRQTLNLYKASTQPLGDDMDEDDDNDDENGVPQINMDELLDDFDELNMGN
jgi:nonsense-mediated mRNA decay protein 3